MGLLPTQTSRSKAISVKTSPVEDQAQETTRLEAADTVRRNVTKPRGREMCPKPNNQGEASVVVNRPTNC